MIAKGMLLEVSLIIVGLILLVATITDIKTTEVPDWLTYGGIAAGVGLHLIAAVNAWDWRALIPGAVGLLVFVAIGFIMYYAGQWGGGDSKIIMAVGALLGFRFSLDHVSVAFLVNMLWVGAVYGLVWIIVLAIRRRKKFIPYFAKLAKRKWFVIARAVSIILLLLFGTISFFVADPALRLLVVIAAVFVPFITYSFLLTKSVENCCMIRTAKPSELMEGDWIVKDVVVKGKRITGPKDLGITKKQIAQLQKLSKKHKIKITVKDGIPFVPSFLIAYVLTLLIGNPILLF